MTLAQLLDQQKKLNATLQFSFPPFVLTVKDGYVALTETGDKKEFFMDPEMFLAACQWYVSLQKGKVV